MLSSPLWYRDETDKELNIRIRMPAWAKGKSVRLDLHKTHIKLVLKEEEDNPIIEVKIRKLQWTRIGCRRVAHLVLLEQHRVGNMILLAGVDIVHNLPCHVLESPCATPSMGCRPELSWNNAHSLGGIIPCYNLSSFIHSIFCKVLMMRTPVAVVTVV